MGIAKAIEMTAFYEHWLSDRHSKAAARRDAQLNKIRERRDVHGAYHPLFWGGIIFVGDANCHTPGSR